MTGRHLLYSVASRIYPGRRRAHKAARKAAQAGLAREREQAALAAQREQEYAALLARVKNDLALDARLGHVEDLIAHLERRIDRVLRELAAKDPATQWEPPARPGGERVP